MNVCFLIGNLTRDPEMTETAGGTAVCHFGLAVNDWRTGADGERKVDFFNVTAWRGLAENVSKYASKGKKVAVQGEIHNRTYEDREGNKRTVTEITAQNVEFLTPRGDEDREPETLMGQMRKKPTLQSFDDDGDIPF